MQTGSIGRISAIIALCITSTQHPANALESRIGIELYGTEMARAHTQSAGECEQQCRNTQGCTGYNFILDLTGGGIKLGAKTDPGGPLAGEREPIPSCTLLTGQLNETPRPGIQSCRMPCKAGEPDLVNIIPDGDPTGKVKDKIGDKKLGTTSGPESLHKYRDPAAVKDQIAPAPKADGNTLSPGSPKQLDPSAEKFARPSPSPNAVEQQPSPPPPPVQPVAQPPIQKLSGYQIVRGPNVTLQQLGVADAIAECPAGKIAISGGFVITALNNDVRFGLEIKGVMPDGANGPLVRAKFRNADVAQPASGHAIAICINAHPFVRNVDDPNLDRASCRPGEVLIGGGTMGRFEKHLRSSSPVSPQSWAAAYSDPAASVYSFETRAVCVPQNAVDGLEFHTSPAFGLSARGVTTRQLNCPIGKVALAVGFVSADRTAFHIADLNGTLEPRDAQGNSWSSELRNRDILGAPDSVTGHMQGLCAVTQ